MNLNKFDDYLYEGMQCVECNMLYGIKRLFVKTGSSLKFQNISIILKIEILSYDINR